jgi:hypothetical protein
VNSTARWLKHPLWNILGIVVAIVVVLKLLHPRVKFP